MVSAGIKLIIDFIPNHSSVEHPWFTASQHKDQYYNDFYIWNDGVIDDNGTIQPPNNWVCCFHICQFIYIRHVPDVKFAGFQMLPDVVGGIPDFGFGFRIPDFIFIVNIIIIIFWLTTYCFSAQNFTSMSC